MKKLLQSLGRFGPFALISALSSVRGAFALGCPLWMILPASDLGHPHGDGDFNDLNPNQHSIPGATNVLGQHAVLFEASAEISQYLIESDQDERNAFSRDEPVRWSTHGQGR